MTRQLRRDIRLLQVVARAGWEEKGTREVAGGFVDLDPAQGRGVPTAPVR